LKFAQVFFERAQKREIRWKIMLDALCGVHSIATVMRPRIGLEMLPEMATKRVTRSRYLATAACVLCWPAALFLGACGEQSPDLEERISHLQKELDRTQSELKSATQELEASKEELARTKTAPANTKIQNTVASPTPVVPEHAQLPVPSRDVLEASYIAEAKTLKKQLQERLKQYTLGSFTLHNVILPDKQFPISSWISLAFQAGDGKQYRLDFPVKADLAGKWVFPEPEEIGRRISEGKKATTSSDTSQKPAPQTSAKEPPSSTVPADSTVVIQWPGSSPAPQAPTSQAPAPQAPQEPNKSNAQTSPPKPQASPPQGPKQSIPADRDVLIRF
jgi:hypothetical protein